MGRMYSVCFEKVAVSAAQDLFELVAPSDMSVAIHSWAIGQSSDAGDSESEQLNILVHRASTSGSGGSTPTPAPLHIGDAASTVTVEVNNTSQGTEGTIIDTRCFNVMAGIEVVYTPECRPVISPSGRLVIELQDAPSDALTMNGVVFFEEIGG